MNVSLVIRKDYEKNDDFGLQKQTQFKPKQTQSAECVIVRFAAGRRLVVAVSF